MSTTYKPRVVSPIAGDGFPAEIGGTPYYLVASGIGSSLIADGAVLPQKLQNGSASPGNSKFYGTNSGGTTGFFDQSTISGSGGSSAPNQVRLTTDAVVFDLNYYGTTALTNSNLVQTTPGVFTLTVPAGVRLESGVFIGNKAAHVSGSNWTLKIVDTDGRYVNFIPALFDLSNYTQMDLQFNGHNPTQDPTVAGTVTSLWSGMGYDNFMIFFKFINRYLAP